MAENKIRFGLSSVYYSILTEGTTNAWATPVPVAGAVNLSIDPNVATNDFYADNISYFRTFSNNGYDCTLEVARIPDMMMADVWGITADSTGVIREKTGVEPKPFALLFKINGDKNDELNVLYRCLPSGKPTESSQTTEDTATPVTQSFDFSALPVVTGADVEKGLIKARTTDTASTSVRSNWFTAVNVPTA